MFRGIVDLKVDFLGSWCFLPGVSRFLYSGQLVFTQLMEHMPLRTFRRRVQCYNAKLFSYFDQFLCMTFAQLTCRESLRNIETCLRAYKA